MEQLSDTRNTIIDFKKENKKLSDKLSSVTQRLVHTQSRLREERKIQEMKLTELGIKLLKFEEDLRIDQKRVKALLRRKDKQLLEKDKLIEALRCQLNAYEGRISCGSPIDVKVSDFSTVVPRIEHEVQDLSDSGKQKSRDFSHLLYLDLNTDQFRGRRFYAHRDLSPVAEVREDLEELISPCRASDQGKRSLFGSCEDDTPITKAENVKFEGKDTPTEEKERSWYNTPATNDNSVNSESSNFHDFSDALLSCYKDQLSPKTFLGVEGDIPNFNEISDGDSDDVKKIIMGSQNSDILSGGIMNSSFEDQMLGITSGVLRSPKRDSNAGKHFRIDPDDNTSHLRRAQKEIRRSLVIDDSEDYDEKDEFYDCQTALSAHTGSNSLTEKTLQYQHEIDERRPLPHDTTTCDFDKGNPRKVRLQGGSSIRNESPDSEGNASLKEEWSDAQDNVLDRLHDDPANSEQYSTPKKTLDVVKKPESSIASIGDNESVIQQNGLSSDLSGVIITSCHDKLDSAKKNRLCVQGTAVAPGDTTLEEYDVIDIDIDS